MLGFHKVMGLGQKILTRVGSAIFGLGLGLENFPPKSQIFQFSLGRVKKYSGQRQAGLLFTPDQKLNPDILSRADFIWLNH